MKNSASNPSAIQVTKQALQAQAKQLLPELTTVLLALNYSEISHQRISQQQHNKTTAYQGLTRAQHGQCGSVMIKWTLSDCNDNYSISLDSQQNFSALNHEVAVLSALTTSQKNQNNLTAIAPPMLAHDHLSVQVLNKTLQLAVLIMPYYLHGSLAHQLNKQNHQSFTDKQKHPFIVQAAQLIGNLHNNGWCHGDIKPSNILISELSSPYKNSDTADPNLLLTDFALAQRLDNDFIQNSRKDAMTNGAGTPAYLAPECWQGQGATVQSDIYAFGIMLYEILMGARPFNIVSPSSEPLRAWTIQHCQQPIATLPIEYAHYQSIINKALAKRVERRYQSMDEVLGEIVKAYLV